MTSPSDMLETALRTLPHGPEFRFIDKLTSLTPGREGAGEYRVRGDEPFLRGHFPGEPIFPGVLLVEAAAQLAGIVAQTDSTRPPLAGLKLAALRNVKILGTVKPGETFSIRAAITGRLGKLVQAEAKCVFQNRTILTASLTLGGSEAGRDNSAA
jgi:3-hydroxyacyl-[acyl-carrier-protein] dehydratase